MKKTLCFSITIILLVVISVLPVYAQTITVNELGCQSFSLDCETTSEYIFSDTYCVDIRYEIVTYAGNGASSENSNEHLTWNSESLHWEISGGTSISEGNINCNITVINRSSRQINVVLSCTYNSDRDNYIELVGITKAVDNGLPVAYTVGETVLLGCDVVRDISFSASEASLHKVVFSASYYSEAGNESLGGLSIDISPAL